MRFNQKTEETVTPGGICFALPVAAYASMPRIVLSVKSGKSFKILGVASFGCHHIQHFIYGDAQAAEPGLPPALPLSIVMNFW